MDSENKEDNKEKVLKETITQKIYVYDTGECSTVEFVSKADDKPYITNYRQQNLLQERYKSKSVFLKMFTGGNKRPIIPQFEPMAFAQHYLNTLPMIKPEMNTIGEINEDGKWINYTKEEYREALGLKRNTFDRFFNKCIEMNLYSVYGRNEDIAIYVNPYYVFNGKQLHLKLCLAFDHDDKFINSLTDKAREEYFQRRYQQTDLDETTLS